MVMSSENDEFTITVNDDIRLIQKSGGLRFGTDALLLAAFIRAEMSASAAEFGCGSGIISLLAATRKRFSHIDAYEIMPQYAEMAGRNAAENGLSDIITVINGDVREIKGQYGAVFTNPPYLQDGKGKSSFSGEMETARREKNGNLSDFCKSASRILKYGGSFYIVYRPDRTAELIYEMKSSGIEPKRLIFVYPDDGMLPCLVLCEGKKGASPGLFCPPAFYIRHSGENSAEMNELLMKGDMNERYKKP